MIWARHRAATHWCAGHDNGSSLVTLCLGRFSLDEAVVDIDPPQQTRCQTCELAWMRTKRVSVTSVAVAFPAEDVCSSAAGADREPATFTEDEYRANPAVAVQYAAAHGQAVVVRAAQKDLPTMPGIDAGLAELARNAPEPTAGDAFMARTAAMVRRERP